MQHVRTWASNISSVDSKNTYSCIFYTHAFTHIQASRYLSLNKRHLFSVLILFKLFSILYACFCSQESAHVEARLHLEYIWSLDCRFLSYANLPVAYICSQTNFTGMSLENTSKSMFSWDRVSSDRPYAEGHVYIEARKDLHKEDFDSPKNARRDWLILYRAGIYPHLPCCTVMRIYYSWTLAIDVGSVAYSLEIYYRSRCSLETNQSWAQS